MPAIQCPECGLMVTAQETNCPNCAKGLKNNENPFNTAS